MSFWIIFWKIVFIVSITLFAGMAVWVIIAGFRDIKKLFDRINQSHKTQFEDS